MTSTNKFIHLRCHTSFSLSEGAIKVDDLINLAKRNKMPALAVTDSANLFCSLEFSLACVKSGIQPIIGCIFPIDMQNEDAVNLTKIVLIAKNDQGFKNLLKLSSKIFLEKYSNLDGHIKFDDLLKYNEGLICLSGGHTGPIGQAILKNNKTLANKNLLSFKQIFNDRFYMEIMRHGLSDEEKTEDCLIELAYNHNIPLVATNDVMFSDRAMYDAHQVLMCIAKGRYINEGGDENFTPHHYFKSPLEMQELFSDLPEAIENTALIAKRCSVMAQSRDPMLPKTKENEAEELIIQAKEGLKKRLVDYTGDKNEYFTRLDYELEVIGKMNFPGYFLIVSDFIKWSKENGIPVGPGRGSGAGSVVAWSLFITDLDPIKFGLLFERFLNPERISLPDFDIDFCQSRRDDVIQYVRKKYGEDKVAQIITFGKLQARAVLRDVGRVLQIPYGQVDRISKLVPFNAVNPVTLGQAIEMEPMIKQASKEDPAIEKLLKISLQLEGLHRHASTHAAGIVIAGKPLDEILPLYADDKSDMLVIQYSMKYGELAGLVKFDFLGLKTLTVIDYAVNLIRKKHPNFDINTIALDNENVFTMMSKGLSTGVFQFESSGMKDALRKLKPDSFEDLIALGALYRPGPMDNIPSYIACKHGVQQPDYLHPTLEGVLKETFGVIIYQEQVMQIAQIMGGYSLGSADLLRRAMGKKIKSEMDEQRQIFVSGAIKNNVPEQQASGIFDLVAKFAGYGFNKAHATAYAMISYQTAYLKANFPIEFFTASLNLEIDDTDKINIFQQEIKAFGIEILSPDVNKSYSNFTIESNSIRYGLGALKNVGVQVIEFLCQEREDNGEFVDIFDFAARVSSKSLNKRMFESLVKSGSFDNLNKNRQQLFISIELLMNYGNNLLKAKQSNQIGLFGGSNAKQYTPTLASINDWPVNDKVIYEFEALGFYLSSHPLDQYKDILTQTNIITTEHLKTEHTMGHTMVELAGMLLNKRARISPKGRYMQAILSDHYGSVEVAFFDDALLSEIDKLFELNIPMMLKAEVRKDEGGIRLSGHSIMPLDDYLTSKMQKIDIYLYNKTSINEFQSMLANKIIGRVEIALHVLTEDNHEVLINFKEKFNLLMKDYNEFLKIKELKAELTLLKSFSQK